MLNYLFTNTPLSFFVQDFWRDEAFTFVISNQSIPKILSTTAADFNPPLYYLVMNYWIMLFGQSEIAMRTLSFIFYGALIFVIFEIIVLVFRINFTRALAYLLLLILNPVLLQYAFETRMYIMAAFFVTLSFFALWTKRPKLYIVATTLAFYTHYLTIFIFIGQNIFLISKLALTFLKKSDKSTKLKSKIENIWSNNIIRRLFIPCILYIPWIIYILSNNNNNLSKFWIEKPILSDILYMPFVIYSGYQKVFGLYYHGKESYIFIHSILSALLWAFLIFLIIYLFRKKHALKIGTKLYDVLIWTFFTPLMLFISSFFTTPTYHPRYFMFSSIGLILLIVIIIEDILPKYQSKINRILQFAKPSLSLVIFIILVFLTLQYNALSLKYNKKRTVSTMYREIDLYMKNDDRVYLVDELEFFLAKYYMKNDSIYIYERPYEEIDSFIGKVLIPQSALKLDIPKYPSRAFIVYHDYYITRTQL